MDKIVTYITPEDLLQCNRLLKASACVVTRLFGIVKKEPKKKQEPWWKKRLNGQIRVLRKDLGKLECIKSEKLKNRDTRARLFEKYKVKRKGMLTVTKDQLLIDKAIIKNCKRPNVGLSMGWIDYKKAFHIIPHSWISRCLEIFGIAENIKSLIGDSMKNW